MTENEKLRALLAEARHEIATWHLGPRDPLVQRIDAALAEPVVDACTDECRKAKEQWAYLDEKCGIFSSLCDDMKKERDEARAEVERLRGVDCGVIELDGTTTPLCGVCLECAFLRGAEAMREAAAQTYWQMAPAIRALPIPEDK